MNPRLLVGFAFVLLTSAALSQKNYTLQSPDGKISVAAELTDKITYSVKHEDDIIVSPSPVSVKLSSGEQLGVNPKFKSVKRQTVNQSIQSPIYKRSNVADNYNEMTLNFKEDYAIIFRVYNEGVAYRFAVVRKGNFTIEQEEATFNFSEDFTSIFPYVRSTNTTYEGQFFNSFENIYTTGKLSSIDPKKLIFLPLVVSVGNGKKVCITEADLEKNPGMYLTNQDGKQSLKAVFAPYPKEVQQGGHNNLQFAVKSREAFLSKATDAKNFPWRVMVISTQDKHLADSDMIYKLAAPSRVADVSWIKPGKVAWDWWNDWNIYGVDFKAGINNATYKYYIDFASTHHIGYVILDEGWAVNKQADLMQVIPEINIKELVDYGKAKNVGIILWAGYSAMNKDIEGICKHYSELGVKGFKVDFMDRDDQQVVDFYYDVAHIGAKYKLMIDFHGAYKPTGLQRTYPNVINVEGVFGLEQMKWTDNKTDMVAFDVTIPFIRMVAGPMDYTQGAMRNATKNNFRPINSEPMSQGTRCHQLAEYIVFEAPFNMLCDNPSNYMRELESTKFIADIPTVWDNTIALDGKIGEYVAIARQKGNDWHVGAMTNWDAREITVDLSFLGAGDFQVELFKDGINADRAAQDYKRETIALPADKKLKISMAPGGGYAARVSKLR